MRVALPGKPALVAGLAALLVISGAAWLAGSLLILPHRVAMPAPPRDMPLENVAFPSGSGATIRGWYAAGCPGRGAVLLLHGVRANRLAMLPRARWLHEQGYGILLIDFQASGESDGRWITLGAREADDAVAATDYLRSRAPDERMGVIGTSMGGAAALLARPPLRVDAMVLEQVYPDIGHAVGDRLKIHVGGGAWLGPWMLRWFTWQTGVPVERLRPIDAIHGIPVPKLLIAGRADQHTPLRESMAMYALAAPPRMLWVVDGARHVDLYRFDTVAYQQHVGPFLSQWLDRSPQHADASPACIAGDRR